MMRPFSPPDLMAALRHGLAAFEIHPAAGRRRVFLMAIHNDALPEEANPLLDSRAVFSRRLAMPPATHDAGEADWEGYAEPAGAPGFTEGAFWARPLLGEVVGDESGRLFERFRGQVRPLYRVARGPAGELLELVPTATSVRDPRTQHEDVLDARIEEESQETEPTPGPASGPAVRAPLSGAWLRRVTRLGDFRELLSPQLAHPERLRETHQLLCFVQLHEAAAPQTLEAFRSEIARANDGLRAEPLTPGAVRLLGLGPVLTRLPRPPRRARSEPGRVLPGDRFFTLRVAEDPTGDDEAAVRTEAPVRAPAAAPNATRVAPATTGSARRTSIPEQYQKPWEFHLSREEALYDMNVATTFAGPLRRLWRGLKRVLTGRRALRKWQALLCGKNAEEQLWGVRPPRGSLDRAAVREWARRTLDLAGYDPGVMLAEWEIFWRRKGV